MGKMWAGWTSCASFVFVFFIHIGGVVGRCKDLVVQFEMFCVNKRLYNAVA